ncbi:hypothetical protein JYU20_00555 [Bacteroidales bacterium AH-315-I05]|nr:hypothetical protein [Bacteroidales bacterium AH-315-I05]
MKFVPYIIVAVLAIVVLWLFFGEGAKAAALPSAAGPPGTEPGPVSLADEIAALAGAGPAPSKKKCKQQCKQLCGLVPILKGKATKAGWKGGRSACKTQCESDCAGGQDVGTSFPSIWKA